MTNAVETLVAEVLSENPQQKYVCTSEGMIETMSGEARSAEVKEGDTFTVTNGMLGQIGYVGKLNVSAGMGFSHKPGLSGKRTDDTPFSANKMAQKTPSWYDTKP